MDPGSDEVMRPNLEVPLAVGLCVEALLRLKFAVVTAALGAGGFFIPYTCLKRRSCLDSLHPLALSQNLRLQCSEQLFMD
jgi:hypothetical protein